MVHWCLCVCDALVLVCVCVCVSRASHQFFSANSVTGTVQVPSTAECSHSAPQPPSGASIVCNQTTTQTVFYKNITKVLPIIPASSNPTVHTLEACATAIALIVAAKVSRHWYTLVSRTPYCFFPPSNIMMSSCSLFHSGSKGGKGLGYLKLGTYTV